MTNTAVSRITHERGASREDGVPEAVARRWRSLERKFQHNPAWHRFLAIMFAARGDRVPYHGLEISVANPMIGSRVKAMIYYHDYERPEIELAGKFLDRSLPTVELGGSIGVVSCFVNRLMDHPDQHVVVEANPRLLAILRENGQFNKCPYHVVHAAIAYGGPTVTLNVRDSLGTSIRPGPGKAVPVPAIPLQKIIDDHGFDRINLVCDIEGTEVDMVAHELETIKRHVAVIIVETHERFLGNGATNAMIDRLEANGFVLAEGLGRGDEVLVLLNRGAGG